MIQWLWNLSIVAYLSETYAVNRMASANKDLVYNTMSILRFVFVSFVARKFDGRYQ